MNLLLIPQYFYPTYGGLQHFTNRLANFMVSAGINVSILSPPPESDRDIFKILKPSKKIKWKIIGNSREEFWNKLPQNLPTGIDATLYLSIEFEDLIDAQLNCIYKSAKLSKRVYVRVAANGDFGEVIANFPKRLQVLSEISGLITPTKYMSDDIYKLSNYRFKPKVINNLIDYNKYYPISNIKKQELRSSLNLPTGFISTWAGRFDETKNLIELLIAWHNSKVNGHLLLIGDAPYKDKSYKLEMLQLINRLKINVIFTGHILEERLFEYYQASDLYVSTSLKEGHSNASIEACACGNPIIGYDVPGISETAISFPSVYNAIVPKHDIDSLSSAINRFYQIRMSEKFNINNCPNKAEKHSPENIIEKYVNHLFY